MKYLLKYFAIGILIVGCNQNPVQPNGCANDVELPLIEIEGDITYGSGGSVINFTTVATDDYEIKLAKVSGTITYNDGGSMLKQEETGIIYADSSAAPTINGSFSYTVPTSINGTVLGGQDDYIEFIAYTEDCHGNMSTNFNFHIIP